MAQQLCHLFGGKCSDREILRENCSHLLVQHFPLIYIERIMYACGTNPMCHPVQSYPNLRKTVGTLIPRIMVMNLFDELHHRIRKQFWNL